MRKSYNYICYLQGAVTNSPCFILFQVEKHLPPFIYSLKAVEFSGGQHKKSDSLFIYVKEGEEESFEEIVPGINIELNEHGEVIGIEILKASRFNKVLGKDAIKPI